MSAAPGRRTPWQALLSLLFYLLLAAFLAIYLRGVDWAGLRVLHLRAIYLVLALPLSLIPRALQPSAWSLLIRSYGQGVPPYPQLALVYAKSWLGRYIPGKLAWIGSKVLFGTRYGIRPDVLALTAVLEAGLQLVTALGLSFLLFALAPEVKPLGGRLDRFALVAFLGMSVLLVPPVFNRLVSWARRRAAGGGEGSDARAAVGDLSTTSFLKATLLYVSIHALGALPLYLVLEAVYPPLSPGQLPYLVASFLLAGSLGTLALFAPSGIGVREGILLVLLDVVMPREITVLAVVLLRLWSIGVDLLFYAGAAGLATWERRASGRHVHGPLG